MMPVLIAAIAVAVSFVVGASAVLAEGAKTAMTPDSEMLLSSSALTIAAVSTSGAVWLGFQQWIGESYEQAPALMLGLVALLAIPPLAFAGLFLRSKRRSPDATIVISHPSQRSHAKPRATTARTEVASWPTEAWVDIEGSPGGRFVIGHSLIRIGRESDNDIRLAAKTVHRYHAVIRRTTEGEVVINDLSSSDGNGVLVNGARVEEARLKKGDVINVGEVRLKFDSRPV
jgi:hypothetical protein